MMATANNLASSPRSGRSTSAVPHFLRSPKNKTSADQVTPTHFIRVRSSKFAILAGEAGELVNDGIYGKAFSEYLQAQLATRGYSTPMVVCENWGWGITVGGLPFGCGLCIYGMQIGNSSELDLCVTVSTPSGKKWSWTRFRFIDTTPEISRLYDTIRAILGADSEITIVGESDHFPLT